jgi:hypothetical protein
MATVSLGITLDCDITIFSINKNRLHYNTLRRLKT